MFKERNNWKKTRIFLLVYFLVETVFIFSPIWATTTSIVQFRMSDPPEASGLFTLCMETSGFHYFSPLILFFDSLQSFDWCVAKLTGSLMEFSCMMSCSDDPLCSMACAVTSKQRDILPLKRWISCLLRQIISASHSTGPFELPKQDVLWFDLRENIWSPLFSGPRLHKASILFYIYSYYFLFCPQLSCRSYNLN